MVQTVFGGVVLESAADLRTYIWHGVSSSRDAFVGLRWPRGSGVFERSGVRLSPPECFAPEARENVGTIAHTRPLTKHFYDVLWAESEAEARPLHRPGPGRTHPIAVVSV